MTWTLDYKGLKHVAEVSSSPQSGTSRKKVVCTEIDQAETILRISSISFIISFNKAFVHVLEFGKESLGFLPLFN